MAQLREYKRCTRVNSIKGTHEFTTRKTREAHRGPGRMELWTVCWRSTPPLRHSDQQQGGSTRSNAPKPGHEDPGESDETPQASMIQSQVASQEDHKCQTQKTGRLEHNEIYI